MNVEQLADELDAIVTAALEKKGRGAKKMVAICGLVPLHAAAARERTLH